jgi:putative Holliday junction resolvase
LSNRDPDVRVLGLDVGERRIGVAISDPEARFAVPLSTIGRDGRELHALSRLVGDEEIGVVVIGLPVSMSGEEGAQAAATRAFGDRLAASVGVVTEYWDERLSSVAAERLLGGHRIRVRERVDAMAATLVLQAFLDSRRDPVDAQ